MTSNSIHPELLAVLARIFELKRAEEYWTVDQVKYEYSRINREHLFKQDPEDIKNHLDLFKREIEKIEASIDTIIKYRNIVDKLDESNPFETKVLEKAVDLKYKIRESFRAEISTHKAEIEILYEEAILLISAKTDAESIPINEKVLLGLSTTEIGALVHGLIESSIIRTENREDVYRFFALHFINEKRKIFSPVSLRNAKGKTEIRELIKKLRELIRTIENY